MKVLQNLLNLAGADLTIDGSYGPATEAAVTAYQKSAGIYMDGIAGPMTQASLTTPTPTPTPAPTTTQEPRMVFVKVKNTDPIYVSDGFRRRHVTPRSAFDDLQRAIRDQGGSGRVTEVDDAAELDASFGPLEDSAS